MGPFDLPMEVWLVVAIIASLAILTSLRTLGIHLHHQLCIEALKVQAQRLREEQNRRLRALKGKGGEELGEVEIVDEDEEAALMASASGEARPPLSNAA